MHYRLATLKDADKLDELLTKLIQDERQYDESIDPNFIVHNFYSNMLVKDDRLIYLCEIDNFVCGYIYLIIESDTAKIDALYIEEDVRNNGVATMLIKWAKEYCKSKNIKTIELNVVKGNKVAKELYLKNGFIIKQTFNNKEIMTQSLGK